MRAIELTKITGRSAYSDTDEPGEGGPQTVPVIVNAEAIRCFYPRRDNRPGTRITFLDGGGFAVTEPFEAVKGLLNRPALEVVHG